MVSVIIRETLLAFEYTRKIFKASSSPKRIEEKIPVRIENVRGTHYSLLERETSILFPTYIIEVIHCGISKRFYRANHSRQ